MTRRFLPVTAVGAVVGALATLAVLGAAPARSDEELQLSSDGSHWGAAIQEPLLDPRVRWVPGDVRTSTFFVRSSAADRGDLTVAVVPGQQDALRDTGFLSVETRAGGGDWTDVGAGATRRLGAADAVEGRPVPVDMRVRLDPRATDRAMVLSSDLDLRVTVSRNVSLPGTQPAARFPVLPWTPLGLLVLGGCALAALRRATRHRSPPSPNDGTPA